MRGTAAYLLGAHFIENPRRWVQGLLVWVLVVTVFVGVLAWKVYSDSADTRAQSAAACQRSKLLGPFLVKDYRDRHVLPPALQVIAEDTVPKSCVG